MCGCVYARANLIRYHASLEQVNELKVDLADVSDTKFPI